MASITTRRALVDAAFALFEAQGYEQTTVDDIALRAGVGRTTFFRQFRSKDEVVFPDHDRLLAEFEERLVAPARGADTLQPVREAGLSVLRSYVGEGDIARTRYRLTSSVPVLRDRELVSTSGYQRLLYEYFRRHVGVPPLQAELSAGACMTVHNHVLRRWLRDSTTTPERDLIDGVDDVGHRLLPPLQGPAASTAPVGRQAPGALVIVSSDQPLHEVLASVEAELVRRRQTRGQPGLA